MYNKTVNQTVAKTILQQIGTDTLFSLGAEAYTYDETSLMFKVTTRHDFNKVLVKYDYDSDLYNVELWNIKPSMECVKVDEFSGVFNNELSALLAREAIH